MKPIAPTRPCAGPLVGACLCVLASLPATATPSEALTISIVNRDGPSEGFNDPTPVAPVGGNPGTTLGAQRLFLFQYAADVWESRLGGNVNVQVAAEFSNLGGTGASAILGSAAPTTVHYNFTGRPVSNTWYVAPLASQFYGSALNDLLPASCPTDLVSGRCPEITTEFNAAVDNQTVLGETDFYYGIDGRRGSDIDFLSVLLHEMGHGLGVLDLVDSSTGEKFLNLDDAYIRWLEDATINPKKFTTMSNVQRQSAIVDDGDLVWVGPSVVEEGVVLTAGRRGDGAVQIYAPVTYQGGSSVSHYDTRLSPDELMEPFAVAAYRDLDLTQAMLKDIGWTIVEKPDCGDANDDGSTSAADALIALKAAVGSAQCDDLACDVNFSETITAADALLLLKRAVGQNVSLVCPLV